MMVVVQLAKINIRPMLDFRELNNHVKCNTGDNTIDIDTETLRKRKQMTGTTTLVDLKSTYLQLYIEKKLWHYQLVKYREHIYCLTQLGFGLVPMIMTSVLIKTVLSK